MSPRQEIIKLFSTFLQFDDHQFSQWASDIRLRRNMQRCVEASSNQSSHSSAQSLEQFWTLYWHRCWTDQSSHFAAGHLSAYLQEPTYWAAQQIVRQFSNIQFGVSDYCQIAMIEMNSVLKGFNPDRGASLKTFANIAVPRLLKDRLRQRHEIDFCSNLGLLRRISKKKLREALEQVGLSKATIAQYQLAWTCFNTLYVSDEPGNKALPIADRQLWTAIAALYHQEQKNLGMNHADESPETVERWLNQCATWVRTYLYPAIESLNVPKPGFALGERQDDLSEPFQESLLAELMHQEEEQTRQDERLILRGAIITAINQLNAESQEILQLYYQQGLTQQQIIQHLQMSQATVSRLTRSREALLRALVTWSEQRLNNAVTSNQIKDLSAALEEWLGMHYPVNDRVPKA
jgi:RNA polymerase sigma factor (sigma-70 family)